MRGQSFIRLIVESHTRCPRTASIRSFHLYRLPTTPTRLSTCPAVLPVRYYATHKSNVKTGSTPSGQTYKSAFEGAETAGPFPLGVGVSGRSKTWKPWKELNISGKVGRMGRQSANLGIILLGGGLFVVVTLLMTTELFASNSPSVLYSSAVDLIRKSDALNPHLLPPLKFTHTPHASAPVRGTTPVSHRLVRHPSSGRDHMLLTFYVHGRGRDEPEPLSWAKDAWEYIVFYAKEGGKLVGILPEDQIADQSSSKMTNAAAGVNAKVEQAVHDKTEGSGGSGWLGSLLGGFTGLRTGQTVKTPTRGLPPPGTYKSGEVHGDYVKNANGTYQLVSLIIDVPSSSASYPGRAVVFWSPEADKESLISKLGARGR